MGRKAWIIREAIARQKDYASPTQAFCRQHMLHPSPAVLKICTKLRQHEGSISFEVTMQLRACRAPPSIFMLHERRSCSQ